MKQNDFNKDRADQLLTELRVRIHDKVTSYAAWEKLDSETETQFTYFTYFLALPKKNRNVLRASNSYKVAQGKKATNWLPGSWASCRKRFSWDERVAEYDKFVEQDLGDYLEQQQRLQLISFKNRQQDIADMITTTVKLLIQKATEALNSLDGTELRPSTIPHFIKVAADAARFANESQAGALAMDRILSHVVESSELIDVGDDETQLDIAKFEETELEGITGL